MRREITPEDDSEGEEADGPDRSSGGIEGRHLAPPACAVESGALLPLLLVLFDECGGGGEDRGEGKEESADAWPIVFCDNAGKDRDQAAEEEADSVFVGLDGF